MFAALCSVAAVVSNSLLQLCPALWTVAHQAPPPWRVHGILQVRSLE